MPLVPTPQPQVTAIAMSDSGYASGSHTSEKKDATKMDVDAVSPTPSTLKRKASTEKVKPADKAAKGKATAKKPKLESGLVEFKSGKFAFKQKALPLTSLTTTLTEQVTFRAYLDSLKKPVKQVPEEHHPLFAKLTHESEKPINEIAKSIKLLLDPENEDSQGQIEKLTIKVIKSTMEEIGERINYGLKSTDMTVDSPPPAGLCIWRFEITDHDLLPADMREKHDARRAEREGARDSCLALLADMPEEERTAILSKTGKKVAVATKGKKATAPTTEADVVDVDGDDESEKMEVDKPASKSKKGKAKAEPVEETEEEKAQREADEAAKAEKKAEAARKKAEREAKVEAKKQADQVKAKAVKASAGIMANWFAKPTSTSKPIAGPSSSPEVVKVHKARNTDDISDFDKTFLPFNAKKGACVAPHNRFAETRTEPLSSLQINTDDSITLDSVLDEFARGADIRKIKSSTRPTPPVIVADVMQGITEGDLRGDGGRKYYNQLRNRSKLAFKTLKFCTEARPGWRGTWTKRSSIIRPRAPFAMDTSALNYEYDSADDWDGEEDEEGEDVISGAEEQGEDMSDEESDGDGWLAQDDEMIEYQEGFDADDDGMCVDPETDAQAKRFVAKRSQAATNKKRKPGPLTQLIKGPCWEAVDGAVEWELLNTFKIQFLNDAYFGIDPLTFDPAPVDVFVKPGQPSVKALLGNGTTNTKTGKASKSAKASATADGQPRKGGVPKSTFPIADLPTFIEFVAASTVKTRDELRSSLHTRFPNATKVSIDALVKSKVEKVGTIKTGLHWAAKQDLKDEAAAVTAAA